jgi:hypothetical protein
MKYEKLNNELNLFFDNVKNRTTLCDFVDDKNQNEIDEILKISELCKKINTKLEKIYSNI